MTLALKPIQVLHIDRAPGPKQDDQDREPNCSFRGGNGQNKKDENLT